MHRTPWLSATLLAAALALVACGRRSLEAVPTDLLGIWKTAAPRHARNFFEIRTDRLVLGVAGKVLDELALEGIELETGPDDNLVYRFSYTADEGYPDVFVVTRLPSTRRAIRLGSRADEWTPADSR